MTICYLDALKKSLKKKEERRKKVTIKLVLPSVSRFKFCPR